MAEFVRVCAVTDVPEGEARDFEVGGEAIALYNADGTFYATEDRCSHGLARLSEGVLDGTIIECPLHFGAFDVRDGSPAAPPCSVPVRCFTVRVEGDDVLMESPA